MSRSKRKQPRNGGTGRALVPIASQSGAAVRPMGDGGDLVRVDAVFHVSTVHPALPGPWSSEPDKIAWTDMVSSYPYIIRRSPHGGHLAGFVAVPSILPAEAVRGRLAPADRKLRRSSNRGGPLTRPLCPRPAARAGQRFHRSAGGRRMTVSPLLFGVAAAGSTLGGGLLALRFISRIILVLGLTAGVGLGLYMLSTACWGGPSGCPPAGARISGRRR